MSVSICALSRRVLPALLCTAAALCLYLLCAPAATAVSWSPQVSGTTQGLLGVDFVDACRGWAVGHGGTVIATTNGGATWTPQASGVTATLFDVCFVDAARGWAVASSGTILRTVNGGAS